jgi:hypothetical protein
VASDKDKFFKAGASIGSGSSVASSGAAGASVKATSPNVNDQGGLVNRGVFNGPVAPMSKNDLQTEVFGKSYTDLARGLARIMGTDEFANRDAMQDQQMQSAQFLQQIIEHGKPLMLPGGFSSDGMNRSKPPIALGTKGDAFGGGGASGNSGAGGGWGIDPSWEAPQILSANKTIAPLSLSPNRFSGGASGQRVSGGASGQWSGEPAWARPPITPSTVAWSDDPTKVEIVDRAHKQAGNQLQSALDGRPDSVSKLPAGPFKWSKVAGIARRRLTRHLIPPSNKRLSGMLLGRRRLIASTT